MGSCYYLNMSIFEMYITYLFRYLKYQVGTDGPRLLKGIFRNTDLGINGLVKTIVVNYIYAKIF